MLSLLTSCGGAAAPTLHYDGDVYKMDTAEELAAHGLKPSEFEKMSAIFVSAFSAGYDAREALIAANRGYDITNTELDSKVDYTKDKGMNLTYVKEVLTEANKKAADNKADAFTQKELDNLLGRINEKDVALLIEAFQIKVEIGSAGFLNSILTGIGIALNWITTYLGFGNYVLGICIFAILIEILMLPFGIKQQKNSIKQASLRPKEMAIKNKYKGRNDQPTVQKMQAEIQELYQRENFSPFNGCLPLLVQMPIIIALYNIVVDPLQYVLGQGAAVSQALIAFASASPAAGGLGLNIAANGTVGLLSQLNGVENVVASFGKFDYFVLGEGVEASLSGALSYIPNFNIGPINFGAIPDFGPNWILLIVPILTFVTYFASSKLTRKLMYQPASNDGMDARQMACSNTMMDITMPAMSTFFTLAVPAVIGVYWAFRSWIGLLKSFILSKAMPLPTFTEEDYKAAAKEMAGKSAKRKTDSGSKNGGTVKRSLHYIDDEDFEDTRERGLARRAALEEKERLEKEKKGSAKSFFAAAPIKSDDKKEKSQNTDIRDAKVEEATVENKSQEVENNDNSEV